MADVPPRYHRPDTDHDAPDRSTIRLDPRFDPFIPSASRTCKETDARLPQHDNTNGEAHWRHQESPVSPPPEFPSSSPPAHPNTFLCTFCWRPHQSATTPSRVVGRRARLACQTCYSALLDLAVCWVCGEIVFRGDECVSLGWCFWHKACYGCLMCGDKKILEGVKVEDLLADDERQGDGNMFGKSKGKEIEEIPLCAQCVEDVGIGSSDDEHLIPLALDRIEGFDGGLSRRRWEARHKDQRTTAAGHCNSPQRVAGNIRRTPSPIYVSSHDPLGEPAFRASAAKPIPKWMQYLPSYRRSEQARFEHPASVFDSLLSKPNLKSVSLDTDEQDSLPPPVPPHIVPVRPNALNYSPPLTPAQKSRPFTLIAEEPVQRPSYTRFGAGQAKHVRFGSNSRGSLSPISLLRNTAQSPSESAEYLDEYNVSIPRNVRSSAAPIRSPPGEANEHHARVLSPFLRRVDNHPLLSNASLDSSRKSADEIDDEERLPFSTLPQHSAAEAISATQKQALGHTRSHSHADKGSGDPVNYVKSSSSNWRAGADGPGENSRRRPPTFQDQLKRVFGFY